MEAEIENIISCIEEKKIRIGVANNLSGAEVFSFNGEDNGLSILDFWRFEFSNLTDIQGYVAEYLVARALGKEQPDNCVGWTDYDILYQGKRIEVKATAYYQAWKQSGEICKRRTFSIKQKEKNDMYVFCLLLGENRIEANPLKLEQWEFYVVPTKTIIEKCGTNKTISLERIRAIAPMTDFNRLKEAVDSIVKRI